MRQQLNPRAVNNDGTVSILLKDGRQVIIDSDSLMLLGGHRVYLFGHKYAGFTTRRKAIYLHRLIAHTPAGMDTDHINGDTLDNRRINLRVCTHSQNMQNRAMCKLNTSGYPGVSWDKTAKKWRARIQYRGVEFHFGLFTSKLDANAEVVNRAPQIRGEFSRVR